MARNGQAGKALASAAIGSFIAGTIAPFLIALFAPPLAEVALRFGPADYFALMLLGLVASLVLASGSMLHAVGMIVLGLLLGMVGTDVNTGQMRYTFDYMELIEGINFVVVAMGVFGIGEILSNLGAKEEDRSVLSNKVTGLMPSLQDLKALAAPVLRGTGMGSILGILPGGGAMLASFASYALEKKLSKDPGRFGKGAIEGVAGPESANNAGAQTSFIPMLTLGIPSNPVMALMIGAMIIQGIQPGPSVMTSQPALFWGIIASMWIGNIMLLILNLPLIGLWVKMISVPYNYLYPAIIAFCAIGIYSLSNSTFDIYLLAIFGALGYVMRKLDCEPAPLLLGFILGPMLEENLRRALMISHGDPMVFVQRPVSATLIGCAVLLLLLVLVPSLRAKREEAFQEDG